MPCREDPRAGAAVSGRRDFGSGIQEQRIGPAVRRYARRRPQTDDRLRHGPHRRSHQGVAARRRGDLLPPRAWRYVAHAPRFPPRGGGGRGEGAGQRRGGKGWGPPGGGPAAPRATGRWEWGQRDALITKPNCSTCRPMRPPEESPAAVSGFCGKNCDLPPTDARISINLYIFVCLCTMKLYKNFDTQMKKLLSVAALSGAVLLCSCGGNKTLKMGVCRNSTRCRMHWEPISATECSTR